LGLGAGAVALVGCGSTSGDATATAEGDTTITVAASPTPHAEILNGPVKEVLEGEGYTLVVKEFTDYVLPNTATEEGEVDANYFQHQPYLDSFNEEKGTHLVSVAAVHFEPFGIYPGRTSSLEELADGAVVAVPNDTTNEARALLLLQQEGLLTLKDGADLTVTTKDIVDNPKNLQFKELEAATIPSVIADVDIATINGNYALDAGFTTADALATEDADSLAADTYANVLVVKEGNESLDKIVALKNALLSPEVKEFITSEYNGGVVAVF
jgi:D-methionine transport system substrate-binding protein